MFDDIKLIIEHPDENEKSWLKYDKCQILINNKDILDIVKEAELLYCKNSEDWTEKSVGGYIHMNPAELYKDLVASASSNGEEEAHIVSCGCGETGCASVMVHVIETEDKVVWKNFHNMSEWELNGLHYEFSIESYKQFMEQLKIAHDDWMAKYNEIMRSTMNNKEVTQNKNFSKANYPFLIAIGSILLGILFSIITENSTLLSELSVLFVILAIICFPFLCIIGLILQIMNKNKTILDKVMIGCNSIVITSLILTILMWLVLFGGVVNEKEVRKQISQEYSILDNEYTPVLNYLDQHKKSHGVYPDSIEDKVLHNSKTFDKYVYETNRNGKGYWLEVYPKNGPIEYYYNAVNESGFKFYQGDGYIDGFMDNDYYFEINDKWHAIALENFSRHRHIWWHLGNSDRETDEWMKNNVEKFEESSEKNK